MIVLEGFWNERECIHFPISGFMYTSRSYNYCKVCYTSPFLDSCILPAVKTTAKYVDLQLKKIMKTEEQSLNL